MPFIETKLNIRLTPEKEANIKEKLGKAISLFPGKSEYWLMLRFFSSYVFHRAFAASRSRFCSS